MDRFHYLRVTWWHQVIRLIIYYTSCLLFTVYIATKKKIYKLKKIKLCCARMALTRRRLRRELTGGRDQPGGEERTALLFSFFFLSFLRESLAHQSGK